MLYLISFFRSPPKCYPVPKNLQHLPLPACLILPQDAHSLLLLPLYLSTSNSCIPSVSSTAAGCLLCSLNCLLHVCFREIAEHMVVTAATDSMTLGRGEGHTVPGHTAILLEQRTLAQACQILVPVPNPMTSCEHRRVGTAPCSCQLPAWLLWAFSSNINGARERAQFPHG